MTIKHPNAFFYINFDLKAYCLRGICSRRILSNLQKNKLSNILPRAMPEVWFYLTESNTKLESDTILRFIEYCLF